jgi:DNA modification methylase
MTRDMRPLDGLREKDHEFNARWLREARRILKPYATPRVSGTHHIIFGLGFALQSLGFRIIKIVVDPFHSPSSYLALGCTTTKQQWL